MYSKAETSAKTNIQASILLSILMIGLPLSGASAQEGTVTSTALQRLEIAFWPEYDRPEVLVMYRGELDASTLLPAQVALPIPVEVGNPHAVAWKNPQGGLMTAQHSLEVNGTQAILHVTVPSRAFRVEYYATIARTDDLRNYTFSWPGGPAIAELAYEIQEPLGATGLEVSPMPGNQGVAGDRLTYFSAELGAVAAGQASEIRFSYRKPTEALTANALAPAAPAATASTPATTATLPAPIRPPSSGGATAKWWPVYVAGALLVGLLAGIALQRRKS